MNWLDLVLIAVIVWSGWSGFHRGLVREVCRVGSVLAALLAAYRYAGPWSAPVATRYGIPPALAQTVMSSALVLAGALCGYALEPFLASYVRSRHRGLAWDRWGGFCAGLMKGAVLSLVLLVGLYQLPWHFGHRSIDQSYLAFEALRLAPSVYAPFARFQPDAGAPASLPNIP